MGFMVNIKAIAIVLCLLFAIMQYKLWFADGGINRYLALKNAVKEQQTTNENLVSRNQMLLAEVQDLKSGHNAIEESARHDLGMVKNNETFYRIVDENN